MGADALNPPPPDPTQAMIFNWMPVIFTFMLGSFPAGLVIYWAWNNTLSVTQQWFIMKRHGADRPVRQPERHFRSHQAEGLAGRIGGLPLFTPGIRAPSRADTRRYNLTCWLNRELQRSMR